jgi:hypothetical protein
MVLESITNCLVGFGISNLDSSPTREDFTITPLTAVGWAGKEFGLAWYFGKYWGEKLERVVYVVLSFAGRMHLLVGTLFQTLLPPLY